MGTKVIRGRKKGSQETSYFLSHGDAVIMGSGNSKKTLTTKIGEIDAVIPEGASSSNKLATAANITAVSGAIDGINAKIPAVASAQNQLADKNFVNSSISTATATFKGTFNLVSDLNLTLSASHSDVASALKTKVTGNPDNNDYAFVQIPTAATTPTEIASIDRYKFDGTNWSYEYTLNNSGFTADQWAAINSGISIEGWAVTEGSIYMDGGTFTLDGADLIAKNGGTLKLKGSALILDPEVNEQGQKVEPAITIDIDSVIYQETVGQEKNLNISAAGDLVLKWDYNQGSIKASEIYKKPTNGIPKTDLASAVQTSLDKANTALQAADISGKEDSSNKVTSFNNPTDTQYPSAKLVKDQLDAVSSNLGGYEFDEVDVDTLLS